MTVSSTGAALPAPWGSDEIGAVGFAGSTTITGTNVALQSGGNENDPTHDAFRYAYQSLDGDGSIVVDAISWGYFSGSARMGVVVRDLYSPRRRSFVCAEAQPLLRCKASCNTAP